MGHIAFAVFTQARCSPWRQGAGERARRRGRGNEAAEPRWGCSRIASRMTLAFGVAIDQDMVRGILSDHYRLGSGSRGPSWLTFLGNAKDRLWSCDLFRRESVTLRTQWVLVVMAQFTRRDRLWRPPRNRRRHSSVPNVPVCDGRPGSAPIPQLGAGSSVPIPLRAGPSSSARSDRNQGRSLCAAIACASTAQITSGGRTHSRRLLVELDSLRAPELGNRLGRSLAIKPTYGG
jgi:hypothetical protein